MFRFYDVIHRSVAAAFLAVVAVAVAIVVYNLKTGIAYQPRQPIDTAGLGGMFGSTKPWVPSTSLEKYADNFEQAIPSGLARLEQHLAAGNQDVVKVLLAKASLYHAHG